MNISGTYRGYEGGTQGIINVPDCLQNTWKRGQTKVSESKKGDWNPAATGGGKENELDISVWDLLM